MINHPKELCASETDILLYYLKAFAWQPQWGATFGIKVHQIAYLYRND